MSVFVVCLESATLPFVVVISRLMIIVFVRASDALYLLSIGIDSQDSFFFSFLFSFLFIESMFMACISINVYDITQGDWCFIGCDG